jgi:hypothetical protein
MRAIRLTLVLIALSLGAGSAAAGQSKQSLTDGSAGTEERSFSYKYDGQRFYIPLIEIDIGANGTGELRFKRGESDEILDCKIKLLPATTSRINKLFEATSFLTSAKEYQDEKDFSNLGWITIGEKHGARERKARFNYTKVAEIRELAEIFRGIATQEMSLFDIDNAARYQPLDLPKQLELLENDLRLERIAEPERLLGALNEIAGDDSLPLIGRNQARRIVESIKKGKFKSPVKK